MNDRVSGPHCGSRKDGHDRLLGCRCISAMGYRPASSRRTASAFSESLSGSLRNRVQPDCETLPQQSPVPRRRSHPAAPARVPPDARKRPAAHPSCRISCQAGRVDFRNLLQVKPVPSIGSNPVGGSLQSEPAGTPRNALTFRGVLCLCPSLWSPIPTGTVPVF